LAGASNPTTNPKQSLCYICILALCSLTQPSNNRLPMTKHCLNCKEPLSSNFCPHCGQSASTHRFSLKHFFVHDMVHGVFHLDKGFFYTIKELLTRPGHSIRAYIEGKRIKHFNYFTFIILMITIGHLIGSFSSIKLIDTSLYFTDEKDTLTQLEEINLQYPKLFTMLKIPFLAFFTSLFFKKSKLNFTEYLILNVYKVSGEILISIGFTILAILLKNLLSLHFFYTSVGVLSFGYSVWFYYQYFSKFGYSQINLFLRSLITSAILWLVVASVTTFVIGFKEGFED
jgi:Protein of unknown function (DUF3667)